MDNRELYHFGIKGMKWGIRRYQNKDGSLTPAGRKRQKSEDHIRAKNLKKKKLSELSNAELRELNNRMQLESQYKNLKKQNVSIGRKFIQDVAYETAKNTTSEYAKKYAKEGIAYVSSNMMSRSYMKRHGHA